jgi:hypothetical protein
MLNWYSTMQCSVALIFFSSVLKANNLRETSSCKIQQDFHRNPSGSYEELVDFSFTKPYMQLFNAESYKNALRSTVPYHFVPRTLRPIHFVPFVSSPYTSSHPHPHPPPSPSHPHTLRTGRSVRRRNEWDEM